MTKREWAGLPKDYKKIIRDVNGKIIERQVLVFKEGVGTTLETIEFAPLTR